MTESTRKIAHAQRDRCCARPGARPFCARFSLGAMLSPSTPRSPIFPATCASIDGIRLSPMNDAHWLASATRPALSTPIVDTCVLLRGREDDDTTNSEQTQSERRGTPTLPEMRSSNINRGLTRIQGKRGRRARPAPAGRRY